MDLTNLWCEIDLAAMAANIDRIRKSTDKKIIAVVKCNAYGLGIEKITGFLDDKVDGFAVSDIDEALKVRSKKPVLILLPGIADEDIQKVKDNFILTIDNAETLEKLKGKPYTVHILVNTGMNRFGAELKDVDELITMIEDNYPNIAIDGIYTHLSHTGDSKYTMRQIESFRNTVRNHPYIRNVHVLNSAGFLKFNEADKGYGNCIRVGNLIYGSGADKYGYKKVYSYKARLLSFYEVGKNQYIGYGNRYKTKKRTRVGIVNAGFVHGFSCSRNSGKGLLYSLALAFYRHFKKEELIFYKGKPVEIIGKCMNYTILNLDNIPADNKTVFDIILSPILADAAIPKKYLNENHRAEWRESIRRVV